MTKQELIEQYKSENPTLRRGSQETGYEEITGVEYDAIIESWADAQLAKNAQEAEAEAQAEAKAALLNRIGITADEAKLLLS